MKINGKDEMFLFETCQCKDTFVFSMVRQFSDADDEPLQIHTDIIYNQDNSTKKPSVCSWNDNYGDFIQAVLLSKAFEICRNKKIEKIDIWMDKT